MTKRRTAAIALLGVVLPLTLATACDLGGGDGEPDSDSAQTSVGPRPSPELPAAPEGLAKFYDQQLDWTDCGKAQCAKVEVPLDYAAPDGKTIEIAVNRYPADDLKHWRGALLVNPGGPGASGKEFAGYAESVLGDITDTYDVIGFDPRGVGESAPIDCLTDKQLDAYLAEDPTPDTAAERQEYVRSVRDFGQGCEERSADLVGHVSTPEAARDMDIIRQAVGDPQLHYYGVSYGTLLGATYADLFPKRVGRMVLDAAIDPTLSSTQLVRGQLGGFQTALNAYLTKCVDDGDCPLGDSVGEATDRLVALLDELDADPIPGRDDRMLTEGLAQTGIWLPLYSEQTWPLLTSALQEAEDGQGSQLMRLADFYSSRTDNGYSDNSTEAQMAINCLDEPGSRTPAQVRADVPGFEEVSPVFGRAFAWMTIGCPDWPAKAPQPIPTIDAPGAKPIVVVGTTRDPATPYAWAQSLAEQLDSGVLLTREGDGHGAFGAGNVCIDKAVADYLVEGTVPAGGTRC